MAGGVLNARIQFTHRWAVGSQQTTASAHLEIDLNGGKPAKDDTRSANASNCTTHTCISPKLVAIASKFSCR